MVEWREEKPPAQEMVGSGEGAAHHMGCQDAWGPWAATGGPGQGTGGGPQPASCVLTSPCPHSPFCRV